MRNYKTSVTVQCERNDDGTWYGSVDEDAISEALEDADLDVTVEDEGIGAYEYWGCRGNDVDYRVTSVSGSMDVDFDLDFQGHVFETDEEQEAAEAQVWASLDLPSVRTSGDEEGVEYTVVWFPESRPDSSVTFSADLG